LHAQGAKARAASLKIMGSAPVAAPKQPAVTALSNSNQTRLEAIFREIFDDDSLQLGPEMNRENFEAWDSLGHIRLVSALEETFGVTFTLDEIEGMTSVSQILAVLAAKG
jgi:acyl carrier protein